MCLQLGNELLDRRLVAFDKRLDVSEVFFYLLSGMLARFSPKEDGSQSISLSPPAFSPVTWGLACSQPSNCQSVVLPEAVVLDGPAPSLCVQGYPNRVCRPMESIRYMLALALPLRFV